MESIVCWDLIPHGPLARYVKLSVAHAPGMPWTFSPPPRFSDPDMHHGTCVTHVSWCMPGSLTSDFLWSRWRGKRSRHSRRMHNPQFYVSGKRPMDLLQIVRGGSLDESLLLWHTEHVFPPIDINPGVLIHSSICFSTDVPAVLATRGRWRHEARCSGGGDGNWRNNWG